MSSEWEYAPLGEVCSRITYGFTNPMPTIDGDGAYMVTAKDIKSGRIQYQTARKTSWSAYRERLTDKSRPGKGDLLLTKDGSIGRLALCDRGDICINQSVALLQSNGKADFRYIKYLLESPEYQRRMESDSDGSTIKHIYITRVDKMVIPLPPVKEQEGIVSILGTLDDKIELNRKTNETLGGMAKALFKSWFVDFDPVRAKAEGRPTGLPAEMSDLFPDSFEDSELGEIPSGWRDGEIQDIAELNPETWGSRNQPLSVRYLDLSNVKHGKIDSIEEYQWEDAPSRARRILKTGDTVVGTVRPGNGSYCLIGEDGITGSTGFAVLRPKNKNDSAFVYLGSCSKENIDRLAHLADGGAYPAVRPELVAQTPIIIAARDLLDCFSGSVSPLFAAAEERKRSSKLLCQARDALLPKLISGEICIPDAEKMLEEVGI